MSNILPIPKPAVGSYSGAQTNDALIANGETTRKLVVDWVVLANGATAGEVYLTNGTNLTNATITANSQANPTVVTCGKNIPTGQQVTISGSNSTPSIDGTYTATNVDATKFSIPVNVTVAGTAGTVDILNGETVLDAFLAVNDAHFLPVHIELTTGCGLYVTSVTVTTHRVNVGYHFETV